jgi:outer membrane protein OmpA-like peptidoglycan-associated protein
LRNNNILLKRELYEEDVYILSEPIDHYELGKVVLTKTQRDKVDKYIDIIKKSPKMNIFLDGHTCDSDSRNGNREVGLHRAEYIRDYLISKGIDAKRIRISSKGETQPLVPNINEENRKRNRRVLFLVE